jgi:hypothetical protein
MGAIMPALATLGAAARIENAAVRQRIELRMGQSSQFVDTDISL